MKHFITSRYAPLLIILALLTGFAFEGYATIRAREVNLFSNRDWDWDDDDFFRDKRRSDFLFRYNRVEGLFLGASFNQDEAYRFHASNPFLYGSAGYAFSAEEFEYQLGFEKGFFREYRLGFGAEYHRLIDSPDCWRISELENTLAALLIREDYHDFYLREGWSVYITQNFTRDMRIKLGYHSEDYDSLERNAKWSFFGGNKKFPANPAMPAGEHKSLRGKLTFDTRNSKRNTTRGWYIGVDWEHAGDDLGGAFNYDRLLVDLRRYQPISFNEGFDLRICVGTSSGILPWQKSYHLGGLGTLRGYGYKEFPSGRFNHGANRMVLAQAEYRLGGQDLPDYLDWGLLELFNLILFADAGWVGSAGMHEGFTKGFEGFSWGELKSSVGLALANRSGSVRLQVARRTDRGNDPYTFSFRIHRPF